MSSFWYDKAVSSNRRQAPLPAQFRPSERGGSELIVLSLCSVALVVLAGVVFLLRGHDATPASEAVERLVNEAGLDGRVEWDGTQYGDNPVGWVTGSCGIRERFTFTAIEDSVTVDLDSGRQIVLLEDGKPTKHHSAAFDAVICREPANE